MEIPLELRRLCLEARRINAEIEVLRCTGLIRRLETTKIGNSEEVMGALSKLDRLFMNDEISIKEYVQRRKQLLQELGRV